MFFRRLKLFNKEQGGFTLIEFLVSLAIVGFICLGATVATGQLLNQTANNNNHTTASRQALNAVHWISRDAQMSQNVTGASGFPLSNDLVISWEAWDNSQHVVTYSLLSNTLRRSYSVNGGDPEVTVIAEYINDNPTLTNSAFADDVLTIKITSSVGVNDKIADFTRQADISLRPKI